MISMGLSSSPSITTTTTCKSTSFSSPIRRPNTRHQVSLSSTTTTIIRVPHRRMFFSEPVPCKTTQAVGLFPSISPEIVAVRDARLEDYWEVADTHCSSFFPPYRFPWDFLLRINRFMGLVFGFSVPSGCYRTTLVAVTGSELKDENDTSLGKIKIKWFERNHHHHHQGFNHEEQPRHVAGILTLDTLADFLPRKGPKRCRRTGIAYISNVAVQKAHRRRGIAKRLVAEAEARALSWGCRAVALHCDSSDVVATSLYRGRGFKSIEVPDGADWPTPTASPLTQFRFMMKLLSTPKSKLSD